MPRFTRKSSTTRSEHWLRVAIGEYQKEFSCRVRDVFDWSDKEQIEWLSPIEEDQYCEYGDQAFLDRLGVDVLKESLASFWPNRGPQWDGLGRTSSGKLLLVEAKAHIPEAVTFESKASPETLDKIKRALDAAKVAFGVRESAPWASPFYQYANRLAHLYFLRELNGLDAYMLFVYFADAPDVPNSVSREQWEGASRIIKLALGLRSGELSRAVADLIVSVPNMLLSQRSM